jgi:hypothetical protein
MVFFGRATGRRRVAAILAVVSLPVLAGLLAFVRPGAAGRRDVLLVDPNGPPQIDSVDSQLDIPVSEPPVLEPRTVAAWAEAIRRAIDDISGECQRAANNDWDRWQRQTAPYRAALKSKLDDLKDLSSPQTPWLEGKYEVLDGGAGFPLFEIEARENLVHLYDPDSLAAVRKDRAVESASAWLRKRGIDLVFVPLPKMTEVYIEHFLGDCPPDGIIAPHLRRTLLDLLDADVEVVDAFSLFRSVRNTDKEYLYNTADTHWAPRAMRVMAKELANRLTRYDFVETALHQPPIVKAAPGAYDISVAANKMAMNSVPLMRGFLLLNADQQRRATAAQTRMIDHVTLLDGREPADDPHSPLLLIGHSYVPNFREQLIRELNLLLRTNWTAAQTTQAFGDFLREPERLAGVRVVVWITTEQHMTHFQPLPAAIRAGGRPMN